MLIALMTVFVLHFGGGGGGFSFAKALDPYLKEAVADKARYEQAGELTKEADKTIDQFQKNMSGDWAKELRAIVTNYDATDEQFHTFLTERLATRKAMQQELLDLRFKMTKVVTRSEWESMFQAIDEKAAEAHKKAAAEANQ